MKDLSEIYTSRGISDSIPIQTTERESMDLSNIYHQTTSRKCMILRDMILIYKQTFDMPFLCIHNLTVFSKVLKKSIPLH